MNVRLCYVGMIYLTTNHGLIASQSLTVKCAFFACPWISEIFRGAPNGRRRPHFYPVFVTTLFIDHCYRDAVSATVFLISIS